MRTNGTNTLWGWGRWGALVGGDRVAPRSGERARRPSLRSGLSGSARRGSVYVMVLLVSMIVLVIGLGSVMVSRSAARATIATADWSEAGLGAQSGVEYALAVMNSSPTWRSDTTSGGVIAAPKVGRATVVVSIVDEADGNLADDPTQSVRVYGAASVGTTSREYSVLATPSSSVGLDVLRCGVYAAGNLT
ncbi:MAG TPA: hypothetical protein VHC70_01045, partial [Phycisphaerales bacterium]|nr:hypothetical protein [Phycisphaerales bacterium]